MRRAAALLAATAIAIVLAHAAATSALAAPRITETSLEPSVATVGDRLTLRIVVEHEAGETIEGPGFGDDYGGLEIVEIPEPQTRDGATTLTYVLTSFETGVITVPPLTVAWTGGDGPGSALTEPRTVNIESVLQPGETDLRPLRPQLEIEEGAPSPALPVLFVAMMAALTAFGYVLLQRAIAARPVPPVIPAPPPTPGARARAALDAVDDLDVKARYGVIAETVRRYLSERYGFAAYAMTRTELEREMRRAAVDRWSARVTANLLEQCDAVQFAAYIPPPERVDADLTAAYEVIELTSPRPSVEPAR